MKINIIETDKQNIFSVNCEGVRGMKSYKEIC